MHLIEIVLLNRCFGFQLGFSQHCCRMLECSNFDAEVTVGHGFSFQLLKLQNHSGYHNSFRQSLEFADLHLLD